LRRRDAWKIFLDRGLVIFRGHATLVLDEADACWTWAFCPRSGALLACFRKAADDAVLCDSGSFGARLVNDYMRNPVRLSFGSQSKPHDNIRVRRSEVPSTQAGSARAAAGERAGTLPGFRPYQARDRTHCQNLAREGFAAAMIHGDRSPSQRTAALTGFQTGRYQVLVAPIWLSRGIHVEDIAHVINYTCPRCPGKTSFPRREYGACRELRGGVDAVCAEAALGTAFAGTQLGIRWSA